MSLQVLWSLFLAHPAGAVNSLALFFAVAGAWLCLMTRVREQRGMARVLAQGELDEAGLRTVGQRLRSEHWQLQKDAGIELLPVGDFAWYDQVLGTSLLVDAVPARHRHGDTDLDTLFRVARGRAPTGPSAAAAEMTKWFNTNYHYLVPEFSRDQRFKLGWSQLFDEVEEAKALGLPVKAVLLGRLNLAAACGALDETALSAVNQFFADQRLP